jgi:hypothetical protein
VYPGSIGAGEHLSQYVQAVWLPVLDAGTFRTTMVRKGSPVRVRQRAVGESRCEQE